MLRHFAARPRIILALAFGAVVAALLPSSLRPVTRALVGWDAGQWAYLVLVWWMMSRADPRRLRELAEATAENAPAVMITAIGAIVASLAAIVVELAQVRSAGGAVGIAHGAFALMTLLGSWLLLSTLFTLHYASQYHGRDTPRGLDFPGDDAEEPGYADFLYFSFTIACTSQTSDVAVTSRAMRRWVLAHSVLAFGFNAMLLALAINIGAGLIGSGG